MLHFSFPGVDRCLCSSGRSELASHTYRHQRCWCWFSIPKMDRSPTLELHLEYQWAAERRGNNMNMRTLNAACLYFWCVQIEVRACVCFGIGTSSSCPLFQGWQTRVYMFPPSRNSTSTRIMNSQPKRKLKPAPLQPHPGQRSNQSSGGKAMWLKSIWQPSTHIMRKMPPQSAVQERFVGSALDVRPRGPRTRPRRLHTTTRRTTAHRSTYTAHLEKHTHTMTDLWLFLALITPMRLAHPGFLPNILSSLEHRRDPDDFSLHLVQSPRHVGQSG